MGNTMIIDFSCNENNSSVSTTTSSTNFPSYFWTLLSNSLFKRSRPCNIPSSQHYLNLPNYKPAGLGCILDSQIMTTTGENEGFVFDQLPLLESRNKNNIVFAAALSNPKFGFLFTCFRCNKNLKGLDVYVYRGEKSYCSVECRSEGIKSCVRNEEMEYFRHLSPSHQTPAKPAGSRVIFVVGYRC